MNKWWMALSPGDPGGTTGGGGSPATTDGGGATAPVDPPAIGGDPPANGGNAAGDPPSEDPRVSEARMESIAERKMRQDLQAENAKLKGEFDEFKKRMATALDPEGGTGDPVEAAEKANANMAAMQQKAENALLKAAVMAEASKAKAIDPEAVFKIGDFSGAKVDLDAASVEGVVDIVAALLKEKTYLVGAPPPATPSGSSPPGSDPNPENINKDELLALAKKARGGDTHAQQQMMKRLPEFKGAGISTDQL